MKVIIALSLLVAVALAAPPASDDKSAQILKYESNNIGVDGFQWAYDTSNGISAQEDGQLLNAGDPEKESIAVKGSYSYTGPDGVHYVVNYVADDNGFQPEGAHIPKAA